jgi:pimeloyl-ACP methyl ester carboxylesterase
MKEKIFRHNNLSHVYKILGEGSEIIYAFHGFSRPMDEWKAFLPWLGRNYSIFVFADFFHEGSEFPEKRLESQPLLMDEISSFYQAFAKAHLHNKISLIAYSSGGRTALSLIEKNAVKLDKVWLFAPDGLEISFWNKTFSNFRFAQVVFKRIVENPKHFFSFTKILRKSGLLNSSLASFIMYSMRTKAKRQRIYNYWMVYRNIVPDLRAISNEIKGKGIILHLIFGSEDSVIPKSIGSNYLKKYGELADLLVLEGGHLLIDQKHLNVITERFPLK